MCLKGKRTRTHIFSYAERFRSQAAWAQVLTQFLLSLAFGKSLNIPKPQFLHLEYMDDNRVQGRS